MHAGEFDVGGKVQSDRINLTSANDKCIRVIFRESERIFHRVNDNSTFCFIVCIPCNHQMGTVRQRTGKRLPCLTTHNNMMARGEGFKTLKIIR